MMVIREQKTVRLTSKGGLNWSKRFPRIVETALRLRQERFVLDGEAVLLERFPLSVNRWDSQRAANKILWPSQG
jgi:ATP-dependent DNA ligase